MVIEKAVLRTIAFFDVLDFAPTAEEVHFFLYQAAAPFEEIERELHNHSRYASTEGFYCLRGREALFPLRKQKIMVTEQLMKKVRRFSFLFKMLPFVRGVAVCNNLAFGNVTEKSDIDLFIITRKNRLFLARFLGTILFHIFGIRRHGKKVSGRFCLSFWMSEEQLNLESTELPGGDPYLTLWMRSLKPLIGHDIFEKFFEGNNEKVASRLGSRFGNWLENFLGQFQTKRIETKRKLLSDDSGIEATRFMLKFHDRDRRREYREAWEKRLTAFEK